MQLINTTIVTSLDEIQELMRHIVTRELKGQINLTFEGVHIKVWQPSNEVMAEGIAPRVVSFNQEPVNDANGH